MRSVAVGRTIGSTATTESHVAGLLERDHHGSLIGAFVGAVTVGQLGGFAAGADRCFGSLFHRNNVWALLSAHGFLSGTGRQVCVELGEMMLIPRPGEKGTPELWSFVVLEWNGGLELFAEAASAPYR